MKNRLQDLRESKDFTQTQMAALVGISQATYSRYESESLDIPADALIALAAYHRTSVDYLLGLTDNPEPYTHSKTFFKI